MAQERQKTLKHTTVYFYHTRLTTESYEEWKEKKFPGHLLYGMPLFEKDGIECVMHRYKPFQQRIKLMLYATKEILFCQEKYDVLYGTSFRGLEIIIFLRALGLYRKPIVVWHHTAVTSSSGKLRERVSRFFYKGIDKMFLFSKKLIADSIKTGKVNSEKMKLIHWGPDLDFYDSIKASIPKMNKDGFISTGKENRDIPTLIEAFNESNQKLELYIAKSCGSLKYDNIINKLEVRNNIDITFTDGVIPYELAKKVASKVCIVICCLDFPYTVGLTTLVEAFALGMPVICSRNPNFEIDIDAEGIGITVEYGNIEGWIKAIDYISAHPDEAREMGEKARKLAQDRFNLKIFSHEITESIAEINHNCYK